MAVDRELKVVRHLHSMGQSVVVTGDMNDREDVFCRFTSDGLTQASSGQGDGATCVPTAENGIDWIFGTAGLTFADDGADRDSLVRATSDHPFRHVRMLVPG
ncbi:endonuclease/exonuclease/phosphatase family protein [Nocardioides panacis]|uniref:Endonuclease/exonuclease/phosphatase family protein n=1 Tax=Nocardioides panacis TaxID=2849501 RepID=A0A975Y0M3_9ACTN|nr:endonuclease/exonuclease/phosphatase family protein [Nocardioides panacis]QWZ08600.1 endonuclease/exonuclease/phosphatase family protein [Nocardioides panacis]